MMQYLLNSALMLACCLCFYKIFLQKITFYRLNRFVLAGCLMLSFGLPLIPIPQQFSLRMADNYSSINSSESKDESRSNDNGGSNANSQPKVKGETNANIETNGHKEADVSIETKAKGGTSANIKSNDQAVVPVNRDGGQVNSVNDNIIKNKQSNPDNKSTESDVLKHSTDNSAAKIPTASQPQYLKVFALLVYLYWFGVAVLLLNFIVQLVMLLKKAYTLPYIKDGRYRIVEVPGNEAPSSFGNIIFINPEKYDWETYNQILQHEKIHIKENHSIDIILAELVIAFQWFNPFAWMYRKEVEINLEFITDQQMVQSKDVERTSYQMSILKVSTPQMPLSLTTNYNQSLIKKRIAMMNTKKSNINTAWKYLFMFPMLFILMSVLNEPIAFGQSQAASESKSDKNLKAGERKGMPDEGTWFATLKNETLRITFKSDDDDDNNSTNMTTFKLSDLTGFSANGAADFSVKREAGTMHFTGKFEDGNGMGHYKFTENSDYKQALAKEGIGLDEPSDMKVMFFIDVKLSYVQMLKRNGYTSISKHDLIPMAALKIDEEYISYWKKNGYENISLRDLIPLHSLNIDKNYVDDIRKAGYKDISLQQLIAFKSQNIDGKYIAQIRAANPRSGNAGEVVEVPRADELISFKAMDVDPAYIDAMKDAGYQDVPMHLLVAMKSQDITPEYVKTMNNAGLGKIPASELVAIKSLNITPDFIKKYHALFNKIEVSDAISLKSMEITPEYISELKNMGYKGAGVHDVIAAKSMGINSAYLKQFEEAGYKIPSLTELIMMKSQNISMEMINGYKTLGFNESVHDMVAANTMGVTPAFIREMKEKGHDLKTLQKYIMLKNALD